GGVGGARLLPLDPADVHSDRRHVHPPTAGQVHIPPPRGQGGAGEQRVVQVQVHAGGARLGERRSGLLGQVAEAAVPDDRIRVAGAGRQGEVSAGDQGDLTVTSGDRRGGEP